MDASALGTSPIRPDSPAGDDVRYDPDFEALQAEIDKMASPTAAGQVDWTRVADLAAGILSTKSKDLNAAAYLAVALVTTRHIPGLAEGTALIKSLLETFWETLYPPKKRMRGRAGAITWWLEKTDNALARISAPPLAADLATRLKTDLKAIDSLLAAKMPDAPLLSALQRRIEALPVATEAPAGQDTPPADPPQSAAVAPPQPTSTPVATAPAAPSPSPGTEAAATAGTDAENLSSLADARRTADTAMQQLRKVSLFLLQQNSGDPLAYRYRRLAGWARVAAPPPVNKEGNTAIAPPPPQVMTRLEELYAAGNPEALLLFAEPKVSQYLFCFDLHRLIAEALANLGASHSAAAEVVVQESAALLRRLPELASLRYSDGTPFADPGTLQWIEQITGTPAASGRPTAETAAADADPMADVIAEARAMARRKQLIDAVALLQRQMNGSASGRQALCWRLAIIRLLLENKKGPAALPHVDRVLADLDRFEVEYWEPNLAVEAWTLARQVLNAQDGNEHKTRAAEMIHRMAAVDPAAALRNGQ